jgi:hypothetical protein
MSTAMVETETMSIAPSTISMNSLVSVYLLSWGISQIQLQMWIEKVLWKVQFELWLISTNCLLLLVHVTKQPSSEEWHIVIGS